MEVTISDFLRFSPFDNKINSGFLRQVYAKKSTGDENNAIIDKEAEFWEKFYINNTDSFQNTTNTLFEKINDGYIHFILFQGPCGSGKTTYLKQIFNNKEKYFKKSDTAPYPCVDIVNLIKIPTKARTDASLLISVLYDKIQHEIIDKELVKTIHTIIVDSGRDSDEDIEYIKSSIETYPEFINTISNCSREYSPKAIGDYLKTIVSVSELIALYFIFYIFKYCLETGSPSVFVFDNLDELEAKYLVRILIAEIRDAFSKAQGFFDSFSGTETIVGKYDFVSNCTIIESVRDGFVADVSSCQLLERLGKQTFPIRFSGGFKSSIYEIAEKRIRLFLDYLREGGQDADVVAKTINVELLEKEKDYIEDIGRLFNYDYRTTLYFLSEALKEDISNWDSIVNRDSYCRLGIKGLLMFHILKSFFIQNDTFKQYVLAELIGRNQCNKYRMYMSLLANKYVDHEQKRKSIIETETAAFNLGDLTKRVRAWYGDTSVSSIFEALFVSDNSNFTLPATLEGNFIVDYYKRNGYNVTLKGLCEYVTNLYKEDPDKLFEIMVVVNPVCSLYAEHVFIHYEYFNLLSITDMNDAEVLYGSKSLFQYETYEDIVFCLKRVYQIARQIIQWADDHVCSKCGKGKQCDSFEVGMKKQFCKTQVKELDDFNFLIRHTPYKTRVITQHINYLDAFRKLLWLKYHDNNQEKNESFHTLLLDYINKYITLFYKSRFINASFERIMGGILNNYKIARKRGCSEWNPISLGIEKYGIDNETKERGRRQQQK